MIVKNTYSEAGVFRPDVENIGNGAGKKVAGPCEVSHLKLVSGGAASMAIYDALSAADATPSRLKWVLDCASTTIDDNDFANPIAFQRGVYAVLEQGGGFNPVLCITRIQL